MQGWKMTDQIARLENAAMGDYSLSLNTFKQKLKTRLFGQYEHHPVPLWRFYRQTQR